MTKKRRGAPCCPTYVTSWGETIEGACRCNDGRLRPIGRAKPKFGGDEATAVYRFKRWAARQGQPPKDPIDQHVDEFVMMGTSAFDLIHDPQALLDLPEAKAIFADYFHRLILTDPAKAAVELDVPHLSHYPQERQKPQFTLPELADEYVKNKRNKRGQSLHRKYKKNLLAWWNEFLGIIDHPRFAREITRSMIQTYYNHVMGKLDDNSPAYVKGRFAAVKSILQYGIDFTDDSKDCRQALDCCGVLVAPTTAAKPEPMSAEHFNALLSLADTRLKAMMLLALNCAMHGGEATATKRD